MANIDYRGMFFNVLIGVYLRGFLSICVPAGFNSEKCENWTGGIQMLFICFCIAVHLKLSISLIPTRRLGNWEMRPVEPENGDNGYGGRYNLFATVGYFLVTFVYPSS